MEGGQTMIKNICIYSIIILAICSAPFTSVMALHDDEAIGKGGAWKSDDKTDLPVSSASEKSIDNKLDKAFQKSPIIIPEMDKDPIEDDSIDTENKEAENSGSSDQ
jgi:hypothetical protein